MNGFATVILAAIVGATGFATMTPARAFDMDCKVILCLAGGFPNGCSDAERYMRNRLRDDKSPFGTCENEDDEDFEYTVPVRMYQEEYPPECARWEYVREGHGDSSWQCKQWTKGHVDGIIAITIPVDEGPDYRNKFVWWTRAYVTGNDK